MSGSQSVSQIATISGDTITLHLTDGGLGDSDGMANGVIVDPVVPVQLRGSQVVVFAGPGAGFAGGSAVLSAVGGPSGNPVVFSVDASSGAGVCSVSGVNGSTISYLAAGSCVIDANQAGDANYNPAPQAQVTVPVTLRVSQTISFGSLGSKTLVQSPVVVSASTSSGLAVTFTTSTPLVCSAGGVNGSTITFVVVGTCTVVASQAGDAIYKPAANISRSFTVSR